MKATTHIEIEDLSTDDFSYEVEVEWKFSPLVPAYITGPMEDCYPAEGGEMEECEVLLPDGAVEGEEWLVLHIGQIGFEEATERAFTEAEISEY